MSTKNAIRAQKNLKGYILVLARGNDLRLACALSGWTRMWHGQYRTTYGFDFISGHRTTVFTKAEAKKRMAEYLKEDGEDKDYEKNLKIVAVRDVCKLIYDVDGRGKVFKRAELAMNVKFYSIKKRREELLKWAAEEEKDMKQAEHNMKKYHAMARALGAI